MLLLGRNFAVAALTTVVVVVVHDLRLPNMLAKN